MELLDSLGRVLGSYGGTMTRALLTLGVFVGWVLIVRVLKRLLARTVEAGSSRFQMWRVSSYVIAVFGLLLSARIWSVGLTGVGTYFGLVSAGLAIALQDPLTNLAGWLFIILRRPFRVGDRIQIGTHIGDVVDIRPLRVVMLEVGHWVQADQSTGRVLHVPNGWVFKHSVANYDEVFPFIWNEIELTITFESDWRLAKKALEGVLEVSAQNLEPQVRRALAKSSESMHIRYDTLTPVTWTTVVESGVRLTMRYLCASRERRVSACAIWERVLDAFAAMPTVEFAYPTIRRFDNAREAKPLAPPPAATAQAAAAAELDP